MEHVRPKYNDKKTLLLSREKLSLKSSYNSSFGHKPHPNNCPADENKAHFYRLETGYPSTPSHVQA